jgi:DNA-binding NarL/FixJ family response regulator
MNGPNLKPRLVSPMQQAAAPRGGGAHEDVRFAALVEEHHRHRQMLTPRELEVLGLLCEGLPNKLIERRLDIGAGTVKCHVANILSKLGVASRLQAVVEAYRRGLVVPDEAHDSDDIRVKRTDLAGTPANGSRTFGGLEASGE